MGDRVRFAQPRCPKCGEPPRVACGIFHGVRNLTQEKDGSFSWSYNKAVLGKPMRGDIELECGGGHHWESMLLENPDEEVA